MNTADVPEPTPHEIVERALAASGLGFFDGESELTLTLHDVDGGVRERRLHTLSREEDGLNQSVVRISAPADMAGQSYLFLDNEGRDGDIWIHLPAIQDEPRRITSSQRQQSFLGSNLTYADLEGRQFLEGNVERQPDEELAGHPVWVIDVAGDEDASFVRTRFWVRRSDFVPLRVRFFGEDDAVLKTLFTEEVASEGDRVYVRQCRVAAADGTATTVHVDAVDFSVSPAAEEFTRERLVD